MPYVDMRIREMLYDTKNPVATDPGTLNYLVTTRVLEGDTPLTWIQETIDTYMEINGTSYRTINEVMGVLSCVQYELKRRTGGECYPLATAADWFYERYAAPYEDTKAELNGDVYDPRVCPAADCRNLRTGKRHSWHTGLCWDSTCQCFDSQEIAELIEELAQ